MASKRRIRRNACLGKRRHLTEKFAKIAIYYSKKTFGDDSYWAAYKCRFCCFWHIGHSNKI